MQSIGFVDSTYFFFDDLIFEVIILYKMKLFENWKFSFKTYFQINHFSIFLSISKSNYKWSSFFASMLWSILFIIIFLISWWYFI